MDTINSYTQFHVNSGVPMTKNEKHVWNEQKQSRKGLQIFIVLTIFLLIIIFVISLSEAKELTAKKEDVEMQKKKAIIEAELDEPVTIKEYTDNKIKIEGKTIYEIRMDNKKWILITN